MNVSHIQNENYCGQINVILEKYTNMGSNTLQD